MTGASKSVYINKIDDMVEIYNNKYHSAIKMKPVDVRSSTYVDFKCKVDGYVRISKYKNIFAKGYMPNWLEEVLVIKKVKNDVL